MSPPVIAGRSLTVRRIARQHFDTLRASLNQDARRRPAGVTAYAPMPVSISQPPHGVGNELVGVGADHVHRPSSFGRLLWASALAMQARSSRRAF
jgi:hypothetical protein